MFTFDLKAQMIHSAAAGSEITRTTSQGFNAWTKITAQDFQARRPTEPQTDPAANGTTPVPQA